MTEDTMATTKISPITNANIGQFTLNPFNSRESESIQIQATVDDNGHITGFELNSEFKCSESYRAKFNEFVQSLISVDDSGISFTAVMPIKTTYMVKSLDDADIQTRYVLDGNTRLSILKQLLETVPDAEYSIGYFMEDSGNTPEELAVSLFSAPENGHNTAVPVLVGTEEQADKAWSYALETGLDPVDFTKSVMVGHARKTEQWFYTYAIVAANKHWLDEVAKSILNLEFKAKYIRKFLEMVGVVAKSTLRGDVTLPLELEEKLSWLSMTAWFAESGQSLDSSKRITTSKGFDPFLKWLDAKLNPPVVVDSSSEESEGEGSGSETKPVDIEEAYQDALSVYNTIETLDEASLDKLAPHLIKAMAHILETGELKTKQYYTTQLVGALCEELKSMDVKVASKVVKKITNIAYPKTEA